MHARRAVRRVDLDDERDSGHGLDRISPEMARVALLLVAAATGWPAFHDRGVTLRYPPTWHATTARLTHVTDPVQVVAIASYPLPRNNHGDDGCEPKEALDDLPATGAFIFGWEYPADSGFGPPKARDFPPRPAHFRLIHFAHFECAGPSYGLVFRDHGRYFQIHVALGKYASPATRRLVLRILDTFHV
jgi:hypothetical protein